MKEYIICNTNLYNSITSNQLYVSILSNTVDDMSFFTSYYPKIKTLSRVQLTLEHEDVNIHIFNYQHSEIVVRRLKKTYSNSQFLQLNSNGYILKVESVVCTPTNTYMGHTHGEVLSDYNLLTEPNIVFGEYYPTGIHLTLINDTFNYYSVKIKEIQLINVSANVNLDTIKQKILSEGYCLNLNLSPTLVTKEYIQYKLDH